LDRPYSFSTEVRAGPMVAAAQGEIDRPFDLAHFGVELNVRGDNLAGLYYLTGIALPFTRPFAFVGRMRNDNGQFSVARLRSLGSGANGRRWRAEQDGGGIVASPRNKGRAARCATGLQVPV